MYMFYVKWIIVHLYFLKWITHCGFKKKVFQVYLGLITFVRLLHVYVSCEIDYTPLYAYVSV